MAEEYIAYLKSEDIYVFPCANRGIADAGKFTTEFNLRMLTKAAAVEKTILAIGDPNGSSDVNHFCAECFINGYYIALNLGDFIRDNLDYVKGQSIYLLLNISRPARTAATWVQSFSNIEYQYRLMPFTATDTTILDVNGYFEGAKITTDANIEGAVELGTVSQDGNSIAWATSTVTDQQLQASLNAILNTDFPLDD